ncbi:carboxypeptidase-like protein [Mucilaginibacter gracilis]|uniref:Carboxypeptidase-like protein n=1 Tax=Mucilaginibacter gracilis TaxID=423350 RepID=A0A495IVL0_9SPHI|nr:DUF5686 and carboxypeptidase regulatory-like domain-containing protein [Mucilaginibacter gracilis]RKR80054.1 carboxypeptidase-like protein [Mucilaginibacter gracilis]
MKKCLVLTAFLLIGFKSFAQLLTLSGTITDEAGKGVPFATIYVKNTTKGTSANSDGNYQIQLSAGEYEVFFRAVGFRQDSRKIDLKASKVINIRLAAELYQLKDVLINGNGEDPAYAIIRKAIKKRKTYLNQVNAYSAEVYIKGLQKLLAAPKKFLGADINKMARENGLDSNRRGIVYLSESQSKVTFMKPDNIHEEMISSKVSGRNNAFSFNRASDMRVNFYANFEEWEGISNRPFVSPIADNAMLYYRYKLLGTTVENGETVNKIQVIPRRDYDPAFSGVIYILEDSWRIYGLDLYMTKKANLNFVDTLKVSEQFYPVSKNVWMPSTIRFDFTGGIFGFRIGGYYISIYKDYNLNPIINKKEFAEVLKITKEVNKKDSTYWNAERPIPLTSEETVDYQKKQILAQKRESKPYLDSLDRIYNKFKADQFIYGRGYSHRNRFSKEYYNFGSLLSSIQYNTVQGFVLSYNASYFKNIDSLTNRFVRLAANLKYGFSDHNIHGSLNGTTPVDKFIFGFDLGSDVVDMNNQQPFGKALNLNTSYSLYLRQNYQKFYQKDFAGISLSRRITGGWQAAFSTEFADRSWLNNTSNYSFFYQDSRQFTSNNPFSPYSNSPLFANSQAFKIGFRTTYDFSNKYETLPSGRRYFPSKYPTIGLSYTKGIKNIFGSDVDYDLLSADISKSNISLGFYGKTSFYVGAGKFLNTNSIYFTDYKHFNGNQLSVYEASINKFLLLDYYKYSTNTEYLEGHLEHNFSGFITNKLPLIRKFKLQEIVDVNYLATPSLKNYTELGFGLEYLGLRAMYGTSFINGGHVANGFRVGLRLGL